MWTQANFYPVRPVLTSNCTYWSMSVWAFSWDEDEQDIIFQCPPKAKSPRDNPAREKTFELRSNYYPALRKMKTPAIQAVSDGPSHAPAPPSCPSAYTSSALTNPCCGQTWHMTSSSQTELVTQRKSTDPIGILCNFFWFIIVPQGQNGTKCSCRPAEQSQGQLGTVAEELPMARKHSAASSPINLNRSIRLFALSIRKYSIKPSGTS